ncbi:MAG: DNA-protecting protein DprA [Nitrospirae bacterium CG_4_10_14_3_um_filter_70_108]|nr:MAG: DNA-protecting protein DprA [Nitrospirae bacterium CG_4_10_14_3_um_filter_70_108]
MAARSRSRSIAFSIDREGPYGFRDHAATSHPGWTPWVPAIRAPPWVLPATALLRPTRAVFAWLCLNHVPGLGPRGIAALLEAHGDPKSILAAGRAGRLRGERLRAEAIDALRHGDYEQAAEADARLAEAAGVTLLAQPDFPAPLAALPDPPPILYLAGTLTRADGVAVAIVGSRAATAYGLHVAAELSRGLARHGATVVSGMATGIDAAAHDGALAAGGRTVAVLGCGVDVPYPAGSERRMAAIRAHGALLSEHPMGTRPRGAFFPRRNRLIAALAMATVVVEAQAHSGAMITARLALELGREVGAVPGNITSSRSVGANRLIRDGAHLVASVADVIATLPPAVQVYLTPPATREEDNGGQPREVDPLLAALYLCERRVDELATLTHTAAPVLLAHLTELELAGAIRRTQGGGYIATQIAGGK